MSERLQEAIEVFSKGGVEELFQNPDLCTTTVTALGDAVRGVEHDFTVPVPGPSFELAQTVANGDHQKGVRLPKGGVPTPMQVAMFEKKIGETYPKVVVVAGDIQEEAQDIQVLIEKLDIRPSQVAAVVGVTALEGAKIWGSGGETVALNLLAQHHDSDLTLVTN